MKEEDPGGGGMRPSPEDSTELPRKNPGAGETSPTCSTQYKKVDGTNRHGANDASEMAMSRRQLASPSTPEIGNTIDFQQLQQRLLEHEHRLSLQEQRITHLEQQSSSDPQKKPKVYRKCHRRRGHNNYPVKDHQEASGSQGNTERMTTTVGGIENAGGVPPNYSTNEFDVLKAIKSGADRSRSTHDFATQIELS